MITSVQSEIRRKIKDSIKYGDSASIISIPGAAGMLFIFKEVVQELGDQIYSKILSNNTDSEDLVKELPSINVNKPLLVFIFSEDYKDYSYSIKQLEEYHQTGLHENPIIIVSTVPFVFGAVQNKSKFMYKNLHVPSCLDLGESKAYIDEIAEKLGTVVGFSDVDRIIELSGGHIGFIKNIVKLKKRGYDLNASIEEIMLQPEIVVWLNELTLNLPVSLLTALAHKKPLSFDESCFLSTFGYVKNGEVFSPLFETYLRFRYPEKSIYDDLPSAIRLNLSSQEYKVLTALWNNAEKLVTKDEIAHVIWGNKAKEKYSDWAITQIMKRIRTKIASPMSDVSILNRKGEGYVLLKV